MTEHERENWICLLRKERDQLNYRVTELRKALERIDLAICQDDATGTELFIEKIAIGALAQDDVYSKPSTVKPLEEK